MTDIPFDLARVKRLEKPTKRFRLNGRKFRFNCNTPRVETYFTRFKRVAIQTNNVVNQALELVMMVLSSRKLQPRRGERARHAA